MNGGWFDMNMFLNQYLMVDYVLKAGNLRFVINNGVQGFYQTF